LIHDPRVHLDPTTRTHRRKIESDEADLDKSVGPAAWDAMVQPLLVLIGEAIEHRDLNATAFPPEGDTRLRGAFDAFVSSIVNPSAPERNTTGSALLSRHVARRTGRAAPRGVDAWVREAAMFKDWIAWTEFIEGIPIEYVEEGLAGLLRMPSDEASWVDRLGRVRHQDATQALDDQLSASADLVRWISAVERSADNLVLGPDLRVRSHLLARIGGAQWLAWASGLPHPLFAALAADDVYDLDFAQGVLDALPTAGGNQRPTLLTAVLVAHRLVELLGRVDRSLVHAASMRWSGVVNEASRAEYSAQLEQWRSRELPARIDRLAHSLAVPDGAIDAGTMVLRGLRASAKAQPDMSRLLRGQLVAQLSAESLDATAATLFGDPLGTAGLLAGVLLVLRFPSSASVEAAVRAYTRWVRSPEFFWSAPLESDEDDLTEAVAQALALTNDPVARAEALVAAVRVPSQGWGFELQRWFDAVPRVSHVTIVIAVAAHFAAAAGRLRDAAAMVHLAVETLTTWLREGPVRFNDVRLTHAVGYTFAFLGKVVGVTAEPTLCAALGTLDGVDEFITAAENFARNLDPPVLPVGAQRALRVAFESRRTILARNPHLTNDGLARLVESVRGLAPEAYAEATRP
jgi:hypothetical protein